MAEANPNGGAAAAGATTKVTVAVPKKRKDKKDDTQAAAAAGTEGPKSVKAIQSILKAMGVASYEHGVVLQLLEYCHTFIHDVLEEAERYSQHRGVAQSTTGAAGGAAAAAAAVTEGEIAASDIKLALQARVDFASSGPPPREVLMELAKQKNEQPLPPPNEKINATHLPHEKFCLTHPNYVVQPSATRVQKRQGPWDLPASEVAIQAAQQAANKRAARLFNQANRNQRMAVDMGNGAPTAVQKVTGEAGAAEQGGAPDVTEAKDVVMAPAPTVQQIIVPNAAMQPDDEYD